MATAQEPQRVSAADFIRGFANWRLEAARKPVVVTHHGKDAHVLISLDDYRRLGVKADCADSLQSSLPELVEAVRDAIFIIDDQCRIVTANPAACDMAGRAIAEMTGKEVVEAFPGLQNGLLLGHINALIAFRQRFCGDVPGLLRPQQWVRVDLVPLRIGGAMILRDISAAMECAAADDARQAFAAAVEALGDIGYARISVRETIENANAVLTEWIGVDEVAIRRVRFSALLATAARPAFAEAFETALHGGGPVRFGSTLVTREGLSVPVTLSIAERRGAYASDGAVVVVSRT